MTIITALEKRIKRRIVGRNHSFFVVTLPGLETLCRHEMAALAIAGQRMQIETGGVAFEARVHEAYAAHLHLRTASRILMRIDQFRTTAFRQLEKHLADFPWELYLYRHQPVELKVATRRSRLIHTAAIAQRFKRCIAGRLATHPSLPQPADSPPAPQSLWVRAVSDRFVVSLDASGVPLYKRGLKTSGGPAPLRETFAAAALAMNGFSRGSILADPMCGTGTFSLEAALIAARIPPGWYRDFAFMGWPCYRPGRWKHLRKQAAQRIDLPHTPVVFASDRDPAAVERLQAMVAGTDLKPLLQIQQADFFKLTPPDQSGAHRMVALNPPYGVRLKPDLPVERLYARIGDRLATGYTGWHLALILPQQHLTRHLPPNLTLTPFVHGGLNLVLATGLMDRGH
jgi:putative N6-adenine-specific DNA methylase